jgi:toxin ParE1/3/4
MTVELSETAEAELEAIADYIARDNPRRALTFVRELRELAMRIGDLPRAFPLVPRYERYGIRRRTAGNYLIFYRIEDEKIFIVHITHGARDYEALLFPQ